MGWRTGARFVVTVGLLWTTAVAGPAPAERKPAVAGQFYPAEPAALRAAIRAYLDDAVPPSAERPLALVAPHAGYHYSGQIAADAYRQAAAHDYDVVVILGANHSAPAFHGVSVHQGSGYRTPLGLARIDRELAAALSAADPRFAFRSEVHGREHSVEVHVPFVQTLFPETPIVAAVVGHPDRALCESFGKALAAALGERKALIVASSDLAHYPAHDDAVESDRAVLTAMAGMDPARLARVIAGELKRGRPGLSTCACGRAPVMAAMTAAKQLGATRGSVISYANSGDTAIGDRSRVVGYGALAYSAGEGPADLSALRPVPPAPAEAPLGEPEQRELLAFARTSIERWLSSETFPLARSTSPVLRRKQGVFVTLKKNGELRGCIGHFPPDTPLAQVVGKMALQAAFNDRRFRPVRAEELDEIEIEISLLTPLTPVDSAERIVIGRDGVVLSKKGRRATYLPEVAVEQGWSRVEMMDQLCLKAGLPAGAWREGAELQTFRSEVIFEER